MKKIVLSAFVLAGLNSFAQDTEANIQKIADAMSANCGGPKYGEDSVRTITNYSLYREFKKQGENKADNPTEQLKYYKDAYAGWKYVFYHAPAWRETPFYDGMDIYRAFAENETDPAKKDAYVDTLLAFYDMRVKCWDDTKDNQFYKAFDWYTYKNTKGNEKVIYSQFDKTAKKYEADKAGINSINVAFLTPWMYTAVNATINKQINEDELFTVFDKINSIVDANVAAGNNAESYKGAADQCQLMMEQGGFLDPQKLVEIAKKKLSENPTDFDTQLKTFNMLKSANMKSDPLYLELAEKIYAKEPSLYLAQYLANQASIAGDYTKAIQYIQDANGYATTAAEKADNFLTIAQIYQRKGDFSSARTYAYKAAEARSGWGEPYILIGDLYAASGSRCGSGTGWESQVVTWAAIDMWTKAKNIDGSVAGTAQSKINKYAQYMPTKADIFLRNLNVGDSYSIGCWIGVTTTVRSSD